jgi:hypothetical protein
MIPFGDEELADSYNYSYEENISEPEPEHATVVEMKKTVNILSLA